MSPRRRHVRTEGQCRHSSSHSEPRHEKGVCFRLKHFGPIFPVAIYGSTLSILTVALAFYKIAWCT